MRDNSWRRYFNKRETYLQKIAKKEAKLREEIFQKRLEALEERMKKLEEAENKLVPQNHNFEPYKQIASAYGIPYVEEKPLNPNEIKIDFYNN